MQKCSYFNLLSPGPVPVPGRAVFRRAARRALAGDAGLLFKRGRRLPGSLAQVRKSSKKVRKSSKKFEFKKRKSAGNHGKIRERENRQGEARKG